MAIWFAFRDAIALVTPYEDLVVEGVPASTEVFSKVASTTVLSAMTEAPDSGVGKDMLVASSTLPHGQPTVFTLTWAAANASWKLCNLATNVSTPVSASGVTTYTSVAEHGSVLLLSTSTPCKTDDDATAASVDGAPVCDLPLDAAAGLTACIHEATAAIVSISFDGWTQSLNASRRKYLLWRENLVRRQPADEYAGLYLARESHRSSSRHLARTPTPSANQGRWQNRRWSR